MSATKHNPYAKFSNASVAAAFISEDGNVFVRVRDEKGPISTIFAKVEQDAKSLVRGKGGDVMGFRLNGVHASTLSLSEAAKWKTALNRFGRLFEVMVNKGLEFNVDAVMLVTKMFMDASFSVLDGQPDVFKMIADDIEKNVPDAEETLAEAKELSQQEIETVSEETQESLPPKTETSKNPFAPKAPVGFQLPSTQKLPAVAAVVESASEKPASSVEPASKPRLKKLF
jgi:hypothetical protein